MNDEYEKTNAVICLGDLKQAAIYFEKVIPINTIELIKYEDKPLTNSYSSSDFMSDRIEQLRSNLHDKMDIILDLLLGYEMGYMGGNSKKNIINSLYETTRALQYDLIKNHPQLFFNPSYVMNERHQIQQHLMTEAIKTDKLITEIDNKPQNILLDFCNYMGINKFSYSFPKSMKKENENEQHQDIQITLLNLNLIDTKETSWEQIMEIRDDPNLRKSFRNLKIMMHSNYSGKSLDYIDDDMHRRIEQYEQASKAMGLKTISSYISQIKNSSATKTAVTLGVAAAIMRLKGIEVPNIMTGLSFAAITAELLQFGIEIKLRGNEIVKLKNENPVAFIIDARKKIA
ncbi:hypothetical protein M2407_000906 [Serratia sp. BIGb0234]|uniref:hypothetical protein n=1 Tax=Serratia sp. BIGb0234 TaxID=2940614 RepID=UPI0021691998|nr:hypothetical protein [Serratia sp. BIGb0234]MCS4316607.1 hypothetical protein [Serratia sp. BIGb0234]